MRTTNLHTSSRLIFPHYCTLVHVSHKQIIGLYITNTESLEYTGKVVGICDMWATGIVVWNAICRNYINMLSCCCWSCANMPVTLCTTVLSMNVIAASIDFWQPPSMSSFSSAEKILEATDVATSWNTQQNKRSQTHRHLKKLSCCRETAFCIIWKLYTGHMTTYNGNLR